ncbi:MULTISPECIES: hypothetical protein [Hyphomicrobiales]|jgi:hypothetical protein|uniref:hypothetical protein n=1 Tax=Hyphomicrobiales TaxID=356 RepID=UPI0003663530|nr:MULTISPECIES: hypothetical protein [Phyllobacteriaceae]MCX8570207.1 hypothetical protein [Aminobacter sp. MET-1]
MIETPALDKLEFRYVFSVRDDEFAYKLFDRKKRRRTLMSAVRFLGVAVLGAFVAAVAAVSALNLVLPFALAVSLGALFCSLYLLLQAIGRRTKVEPFEPIEIVTSISEQGVSNRTPYVSEEVAWIAVRRIYCLKYGIVFEAINTRWYVPQSAFGSLGEMHAAYHKVRAYKDLYMRPVA